MIKEIELRNWKTHGRTRLIFQSGVNVLIGIMGAGKSSVMEAISFALFGTFPAIKQRRIKLENVIKSRPSQEGEAEVKLAFAVGSDQYTVTRKITSSGMTTARLDKNGSHLQSQPIRVNEEIASILKVDYDTFARAVYSEQNGLDYFLSIAKGDRKKQIDGMLGLDQFAAAEENCTSLINSMKSAASSEGNVLGSMDVASLNKQLEKAGEERGAASKELAALKESGGSMRADVNRMVITIDEQRKLYRKKDDLSKKIVELSGKVQLLNGEIEKIDAKIKGAKEETVKRELEGLLVKEKESRRSIEEMENTAKDLTKNVAGLQAAIKSDEAKLVEKKKLEGQMHGKDHAALDKELLGETDALNALINKVSLDRSRLADIDNSIKELQRHLAKCPICERALGPELSDKLITDKRAIVGIIKEEMSRGDRLIELKRAAVKKISDAIASLTLASSRMKDYAGVEDVVASNRTKLLALSKELEKSSGALSKKREELESVREKAQENRSSLELYKKRAEHAKEIMEYSKLVDECKRDSDSIKVSQKDMEEAQSGFAEKSASLAKITATVSGIEKQIASLDIGITSLVKQIDSIGELQQRLERRRSTVKNLNVFKSALVETEAFLRGRLTQSINSLMQSIWPELYPYTDYQKLRLSAKPDDYLLEASVHNGGVDEWVQVDAVASGGERSMACLAMRIAMSMVVVPNLRWLILDEPTHNIDASGISKLIDVLGDALPKVVEQVFIITHDDNLKQITSAKIYQLDRDKGSAGSTTVSEL